MTDNSCKMPHCFYLPNKQDLVLERYVERENGQGSVTVTERGKENARWKERWKSRWKERCLVNKVLSTTSPGESTLLYPLRLDIALHVDPALSLVATVEEHATITGGRPGSHLCTSPPAVYLTCVISFENVFWALS